MKISKISFLLIACSCLATSLAGAESDSTAPNQQPLQAVQPGTQDPDADKVLQQQLAQQQQAEQEANQPNGPNTTPQQPAPGQPRAQGQQPPGQQQVQAAPPPQQPGCGVNQITDPRVPPAGTYKVQNPDGSSNDVYTTGDKKPYYVDNPCGSNNNGTNLPPQVFVQPDVGPNTGAPPSAAPGYRGR